MRKVFLSACVMACILASCNNEDATSVLEQQESLKTINLSGKEIKNVNGTLSFESEGDLKEIAENLISFVPTKSMDGALTVNYAQVEELRENGFTSLYDVFVNAINDVDSYYSRIGGYEEFKTKYSSLFFPEVGDDISPYLPISDKQLAMLADTKGEVLIANQKVSLKDITTYEQLVDLGQTLPDGISLTAERGDVVTGTNEISETRVGDNKVWVKTHYKKKDGSIPVMQVEVCFRKKYWLGWSNHNSNTTAKLGFGSGLQMYAGKDHESAVAIHGFSSHDYYYAIPNMVGIPSTIPVNQEVIIDHGGTGLTLKLQCKYDSYMP